MGIFTNISTIDIVLRIFCLPEGHGRRRITAGCAENRRRIPIVTRDILEINYCRFHWMK